MSSPPKSRDGTSTDQHVHVEGSVLKCSLADKTMPSTTQLVQSCNLRFNFGGSVLDCINQNILNLVMFKCFFHVSKRSVGSGEAGKETEIVTEYRLS